MAALQTKEFQIPKSIANEIFEKAQKGSTLAQLSGARPQKFGTEQNWILTAPPKAEIVGEGDDASPTPTTYAPKTVKPVKLKVTTRFSKEIQWADEDAQIGILKDITENASIALGRALDLVGIHKINPLTGAVASSIDEGIADTTQVITLSDGKYDTAVEAGAGLVIDAGYISTGIAMDPSLSFGLATMRDTTGRRIYPELGYGVDVTNFEGMNVSVSDTVSAKNEASAATNILGIVGQFDAFRWGVQRDIAGHLVTSGDPDGLGDLERKDQIALVAEIVYGVGIMDPKAFAKIIKATA